MIAIIHTNLKWTDRSKEPAREAMSTRDTLAVWAFEPDGPVLEMDVDERYTMDCLTADAEELRGLGSVGEIILADTCSDYSLIKVSILRGEIKTVAIHQDDISGIFKPGLVFIRSAISVNLNEI